MYKFLGCFSCGDFNFHSSFMESPAVTGTPRFLGFLFGVKLGLDVPICCREITQSPSPWWSSGPLGPWGPGAQYPTFTPHAACFSPASIYLAHVIAQAQMCWEDCGKMPSCERPDGRQTQGFLAWYKSVQYNQHKHGAFGNRNLPSASNPGGKEVQSHLRRPSRQFIEPHVKVILENWQTWQSATVRNSTIHRSWQPPIPAFWGSANPKGVISNDKPMIYARNFLGHVC